MIKKTPLPYAPDGAAVVERLRNLPWLMWLDSGPSTGRLGRYDIIVAAPVRTLVQRQGQAVVSDPSGSILASGGDAVRLLREILAERRTGALPPPFSTGLCGYFSYDLGLRWEGLDSRHPLDSFPELAVGLYDWAIVSDHEMRVSYWVGRPSALPALEQVQTLLSAEPAPTPPFHVVGPLQESPAEDVYRQQFAAVQRHIRDGDCYQVNLARRLSAGFSGDPWHAYRYLRARSPAPFGAYLELPHGQILSVSPERFLRLDGRTVETRPIKGTRPRRVDPAEDAAQVEALRSSAKERAENVMIVDLLRNDLGRVCRNGSIEVTALCEIESFATVHHMVSTIRGQLRPECDALDLLRACLPGGSISGAPKHQALKVIDSLEPARRQIYCGAIGYLGDDGRMDTNIAIRTALCAHGRITYWAGGGLVADSEASAEFQETLQKARPFLDLFEASRLRE